LAGLLRSLSLVEFGVVVPRRTINDFFIMILISPSQKHLEKVSYSHREAAIMANFQLFQTVSSPARSTGIARV
jgi:hypothetical protein